MRIWIEGNMTPEMRRWAVNASTYGGSFMAAFAKALLTADPENFLIVRPTAVTLMEKYPKYTDLERRDV